MRLPDVTCCSLLPALLLGACTPDPLPVLTFDTRSRACVDQMGDGACNAEWSRPGDSSLQTDYLSDLPYAAVAVVALDGGEYIEFSTPGAELVETRELSNATVLTYALSDDPTLLPRLGHRVRIDPAGEVHVGGDTNTSEARLLLEYRYSPEAFDLDRLRSVEVHVVLSYQNTTPTSPVADDRAVVYGARVGFGTGQLAALAAGMGPDNVLDLLSDPLLLERWTDGQGQPVDRVEQISLTILP